MGKNQESLEESREIRAYLLGKYGMIPESIIPADWSIRTDRREQKTYLEHRKKAKHWGTPLTLSDLKRGVLHSDFPHNISRFLIKFLTEERLEEPGYFSNYFPTVLDPFAGFGFIPLVCEVFNRKWIGYEVDERKYKLAAKFIRERQVTDIVLEGEDPRSLQLKLASM